MPRKMRAALFATYGGPEGIEIGKAPIPQPGPGEVRIKVEAIGLNRAEIMLREGVYHERPIFPSRIGYEAAGVVEALGAGVSNVKEGDRVATVPSFALSQTLQGTYGESAVVPAEVALPYPPALSAVQGAAIWMQYLTAYGALVDYGGLGPDDTALITAASSRFTTPPCWVCLPATNSDRVNLKERNRITSSRWNCSVRCSASAIPIMRPFWTIWRSCTRIRDVLRRPGRHS